MDKKEYYKEYYKRNREKEIARTRKYYDEHKEEYARLRHERYIKSNKELLKERERSHAISYLKHRIKEFRESYFELCQYCCSKTGEDFREVYHRFYKGDENNANSIDIDTKI